MLLNIDDYLVLDLSMNGAVTLLPLFLRDLGMDNFTAF